MVCLLRDRGGVGTDSQMLGNRLWAARGWKAVVRFCHVDG